MYWIAQVRVVLSLPYLDYYPRWRQHFLHLHSLYSYTIYYQQIIQHTPGIFLGKGQFGVGHGTVLQRTLPI